jgi:hypothetical protein
LRPILPICLAACGFTPGQSQQVIDAPNAGSDTTMTHDGPPDTPGATVRRKSITIHGGMIAGNQDDFPVWIALHDTEIGGRARDDGADIFFTDATGAALDYEIQSWVAPDLGAWVRLPHLAHNTDATIYIEYGDQAKATAPNAPGVFKSSYAAVWHLDDSLAVEAIAEATGTHAGSATGLATGDHVPGQLGSGVSFDGTGTGMISFTNPLTGANPHTVTVWVNQTAVAHTSAIVTMGSPMTDKSRFLYGQYGTNNSIGYGYFNDDIIPNTNITGNWKMLAWTLEGSNKKNHMYIDGIELGNGQMSGGNPATAGTAGVIGYAPETDYGPDNGFSGVIDELRIATVMRDPSWLATEFANQSNPSAFYAVGAEEMVP